MSRLPNRRNSRIISFHESMAKYKYFNYRDIRAFAHRCLSVLEPGTRLLSIDERDITREMHEEVVEMLNNCGERVNLRIQRPPSSQTFNYGSYLKIIFAIFKYEKSEPAKVLLKMTLRICG